jgi:hypothetical protein
MRRRYGALSCMPSMAVASALLFGACTSKPATDASQSSPPQPSVSTPASPTVSVSPSVEASATASATSSPAALEDGRHFGFIMSIDASGSAMVFDLALFLTGDAANQAAIEDGVIQPGETIDNDYYIRNNNTKLRDLVLSPDVQIVLVNWPNCCETTVSGALADFAASFTTPTDVYHGAQSPYWLTVDGGVVTKIEEQYLP